MGKIYTFDQIVNKTGPSLREVLCAKQLALQLFACPIQRGMVEGVSICGSAVYEAGKKSDLDMLVLTTGKIEQAQEEARRVVQSIQNETNVVIEPVVLDKWKARHGYHTLDTDFYDRLTHFSDERSFTGIDPALSLNSSRKWSEGSVTDYLRYKKSRLSECLASHSKEEKYEGLRIALESPLNIERMLVPRTTSPQVKAWKNDAQGTMLTDFRAKFFFCPERRIYIDPFNFLLRCNTLYGDLLQGAVSGSVRRRAYEREISSMVTVCIPAARDWVRDLQQWSRLREGKEGKPISMEEFTGLRSKER